MKLVTYILFMFFIVPTAIKVGYMIDYTVQYDVYATELCENRDQPDLKCNGKCQLMKNIESVDANNDLPPETPNISFLEQHLISDNQNIHLTMNNLQMDKQVVSPFWKNHYEFIYLSEIEHPPKKIA